MHPFHRWIICCLDIKRLYRLSFKLNDIVVSNQVELYYNIFDISFFFQFSEIGKVRGNLFQINGKKNEPLVLPDAAGPSISLSEKVYVPIKEFPDVSNNK